MNVGQSQFNYTVLKKQSKADQSRYKTANFSKKLSADTFQTSLKKKNNISFGYNLELNKKLVAEAQSGGKDFIVDFVKLCNKLEDKLFGMEKAMYNGDKTIKQKNIDAIAEKQLMPTKKALADAVEEHFPHLNYKKVEADTYFEDACKLEDELLVKPDWRLNLSDELKPVKKSPSYMQNSKPAEGEFVPGENSPRGFQDVAGMNKVKEQIQEWIIDPIKKPELKLQAKAYGIKQPNGFLFHGVPGCGKTFLAEATAAEAGIPLFKLEISKLGSKFIHETSNNIKKIFTAAGEKAKQTGKPVLMFIDEIDAIAPARDGLGSSAEYKTEEIATLLQELNDSPNKNLIVIAATNKRQKLDDAIIRSGRFSKHFFVGLPDKDACKGLLVKQLSSKVKGRELLKNDEALEKLAKDMDGFSNSDIVQVMDDASMMAFKKGGNIEAEHISEAIKMNEHFKNKDLTNYEPDNISHNSNNKKKQIGYIWEEDKKQQK